MIKEVNPMPTKGTKIVAARVPDDTIAIIMIRAKKRNISLNAWLNWAINIGLRRHRKGGDAIE